ncbi:VWA domain-containing protein [Deinococcus cellulosilyticus]|uniref:VWFA domain-containing protein n=1 Tax=Deinococcus cellulosilyticus (strain DSM 18568 / NBRC 106333 / KACC 11606 / 5516J-15) TaxID=1223518 RepID=A0A511MWJ7_DEIC1|nr:VWA domain-containing protein [Deinococcus cellulosilyticus]GEM44952.1 hypothetical protein DC3_05870 [Deinococcus cellulosilyticus NBRC 106333 = KACC 11606]
MNLPRITLLLGFMLVAQASAQTRVQLILDASGSMYNKMPDGQTRIQVAKDVLTGFVASLPDDPQLNVGLRLYGAKTMAVAQGACQDSELVLPMQGLNRAALQDTVRKTTPKGATPIAYSLLKAAEDFPNDASKKLVVLVTDGQESCRGDLKAAMELFNKRGIELKIIGIDLDDRAQRSFNGIGSFQNTTSANQLASALGTAVQQVAPPVQKTVPVNVQLTIDGKPSTGGNTVTLLNVLDGKPLPMTVQNSEGQFRLDVPVGTYTAQVNTSTGVRTFTGLTVNATSENRFAFEVGELRAQVDLTFSPQTPSMGSTVKLQFKNVPEVTGDTHIFLAEKDDADNSYVNYTAVQGKEGEAEMRIPEIARPMEFRFVLTRPDGSVQVLGRSAAFTPQEVAATVQVPAEITAGDLLRVLWTGPANSDDYITVVPEGTTDGGYGVYGYVSGTTSPLEIRTHPVAGNFEVRYMSGEGRVLARQAFRMIKAQYSISAPQKANVGQEIKVSWKGPGQPGDYITIVEKDAPEGTYTHYFYADTPEGTGTLNAPQKAGAYQVRYATDNGGTVMTAVDITIEGLDYSLTAPASVVAGNTVSIQWKGADAQGDYLTLVPKDAEDGVYAEYVYTRAGNPVELRAPQTPGDYEIRYQSEGLGNAVLARTPIKVTGAQYNFRFPRSVMAGTALNVDYDAPGNAGEFLVVVPKGTPDGDYQSFYYTSDGTRVVINTPSLPGEYEVRYMFNSQVLHRQPLTLTQPKATIQAPASGPSGGIMQISWTGPANPEDRIVIARKGMPITEWIDEHGLGEDRTFDINLPEEPGDYELRYLTQAGTVLVTVPFKVQ